MSDTFVDFFIGDDFICQVPKSLAEASEYYYLKRLEEGVDQNHILAEPVYVHCPDCNLITQTQVVVNKEKLIPGEENDEGLTRFFNMHEISQLRTEDANRVPQNPPSYHQNAPPSLGAKRARHLFNSIEVGRRASVANGRRYFRDTEAYNDLAPAANRKQGAQFPKSQPNVQHSQPAPNLSTTQRQLAAARDRLLYIGEDYMAHFVAKSMQKP